MGEYQRSFLPQWRLIGFCTLLLCLGCGPVKDENTEKMKMVRIKIDAIRENIASGDTETAALLDRAEQGLDEAESLITEESRGQATVILDKILGDLDTYLNADVGRAPGMSEVQPIGPNISWRGTDGFVPMTSPLHFEEVKELKTGARSLVVLRPGNQLTLEVLSESAVVILPKQNGLLLNLDQGTLRVDKPEPGSLLELGLSELHVTITDKAKLEIANLPLMSDRYIACYDGSVDWVYKEEMGSLSANQALTVGSMGPQKIALPPTPRIEAPMDHETVKVEANQQANVAFRWYTEASSASFQLQVGDESHFAARVHDKQGLSGFHETLPLAAGKYVWRVRGFAEANQIRVPGAFSKTMTVYVTDIKLSENPVAEPTQTGPLPTLTDVTLEAIGLSVIVAGKTEPGNRVKVNGESAITNEDGSFRGIIEARPGLQTVRISVTNPETGAELLKEHQLQI